jgi:hypothetical protein
LEDDPLVAGWNRKDRRVNENDRKNNHDENDQGIPPTLSRPSEPLLGL